jgi:hypothetical protein
MFNKIEKKFLKKGRIWGKTLLFNKSTAISFIYELRKAHIPILGIDAFRVVGNSIQPIMEYSIDFSLSEKPSLNSWDDSSTFISLDRGEDLLFEVVCN